MTIYDGEFRSTRRRDAFYKFRDVSIHQVIVDLNIELEPREFSNLVETVIQFGTPALKISIDDDSHSLEFFVLFDSMYGDYTIAQGPLPKNSSYKTFHLEADAIKYVKDLVRQTILS